MSTLLQVSHLNLYTPNKSLLFSDLSFTLNKGQLVRIKGANGSGKSTLIKAIVGQYTHYSGVIKLNVKKDKLSLLSQMGNLQFLLPFNLRQVIQTQAELSEAEIIKFSLLPEKSLNLSWNTASGGERQKALLTRTMLSQSDLLVLDEPFNHLDEVTKQEVIIKIKKLLAKGTSIIINSHESQFDDQLDGEVIDLKRLNSD